MGPDRPALVLGIETSCDETAAAVVSGAREVKAERLLSQLAEHAPYGGIVPEIAARAHLDHLDRLIAEAMAEAAIGYPELAAVAATGGPGLIGGVIVGVMAAKAIAAVAGVPFIAVNHLEGHALTARFTDRLAFPYLVLLVSGGHCQLLGIEGVGRYRRYGTTIDDAVGEAFDKTAKMLGLGYPGGPEIERLAEAGDPARFALPRPMKGRPGCDFSFSGLKTAVRHAIAGLGGAERLGPRERADIAASLQEAIVESVADRTANGISAFAADHPRAEALVVAGGVAANTRLRAELATLAAGRGFRLIAPPARLCTDNAVMIAWAGIERLAAGLVDGLDFAPRPRWPLDAGAPPVPFAGVKA
ncbi:MAG: tRNA (adenosine(37)-N6)-threonylcarbamoyltransferase complex transferase subunit TsaD [Proteobacteria bacterium]|nr:tRNA (adenosine(37)-N6)-threonylcarbamoyltransferase complex transferase subunit TsaD [Pseudomonadota bacterium]